MNTNLYNMAEGKTRATKAFLESRTEPQWNVDQMADRQLEQEERDSGQKWNDSKRKSRYETIQSNISKNLGEARLKHRAGLEAAWNHYNAGHMTEALEAANAPLKGGY